MDISKYTQLFNSDGVRIAGFNGAVFETARLVSVFHTLSTEAPPAGADKVIIYDPQKKWGVHAFTIGDFFIKGYYTYRFDNRTGPYAGSDQMITNWELCAAAGAPIPSYKGVFGIKIESEWLWSGIITENMAGWRNLQRDNLEDHNVMARAIEQFAARGMLNRDMHSGNVMTDGNGNFKVVDLDTILFGQDPATAKAMMEDYYRNSLSW